MNANPEAYLVGGGIGSPAAATFMIRDGGYSGENISILEASTVIGGSLDGAGEPTAGCSLRGGRMLTTDNYECTRDLFKSIFSLRDPARTMFEETVEFNEHHHSHSMARLVNRHRARVPVKSMGFTMRDRTDLLHLGNPEEDALGEPRIADRLSPGFFETGFWYMWATTSAFQPWQSAIEFKRYLHRFMLEFCRIEMLAGVKRTIYSQYDSLMLPLQSWLQTRGVRLTGDCTVTGRDHEREGGEWVDPGLKCLRQGRTESICVPEGDLVFLQNGSSTDASSPGSMTRAPAKLMKAGSCGWHLWQELARQGPPFGNPAFKASVAQSPWMSFTGTLKDRVFFDEMIRFSGNRLGTGGLLIFKDSSWLMSIALAHQPRLANQPGDVQVFWGYALFPGRIGDFVAKPMSDCNGAEVLQEVCGHVRFDLETVRSANGTPCRMPCITSMFMPRQHHNRPPPVPAGTRNLGFVSPLVEIAGDVVFTVKCSVRAARMAVCQLLGVSRALPTGTRHDKSIKTRLETRLRAFA